MKAILNKTNLNDLILGIGSLILCLAVIPAITKGSVLPISTTVPTFTVLAIFSINFLHMRYWYAALVEIASVVAWGILMVHSLAA